MRISAARIRTIVATMAISPCCVSCGEDHGLVTVRGKVHHKGRPASGASVIFHLDGGDPVPADKLPPSPPSAVVNDAGDFALASGDWGSGALPGKYKVLVRWPDTEALKGLDKAAQAKREKKLGRDYARIPSDRLKGRYSKAERPILFAEVKPGINDLPPFELVD